jgi:hypothetical protein
MRTYLSLQTTECPGPYIGTGGDSATIRHTVDLASAVGFEMLHTHVRRVDVDISLFDKIYLPCCLLQVDGTNLDPSYIAQVKADVAYAHAANMMVRVRHCRRCDT